MSLIRLPRSVAVLLVLTVLLVGCAADAPAQTAPSTGGGATAESSAATEQKPPAGSAETDQPAVLEPSEPFGRTTVVLRDPDGETEIQVPAYDAFDGPMRQRGLMHREHLPANAGMVFRFPRDSAGGFWMRNTLIPLSIAYFTADGEIVTMLDMEPCTTMTCPSYPADAPYRGALEVNQGFFAEHGVSPGWRVELPPDLPQPS